MFAVEPAFPACSQAKREHHFAEHIVAAAKANTLPEPPKAMMAYREYNKSDRILWVTSQGDAVPLRRSSGPEKFNPAFHIGKQATRCCTWTALEISARETLTIHILETPQS